MIELYLVLFTLFWLICGFLAYGHDLAHFQREWPRLAQSNRSSDVRSALWVAITGPIGLSVSLGMHNHGFMWRLPPKED